MKQEKYSVSGWRAIVDSDAQFKREYVYLRKDGGTTYCYNKLEEDSNIHVVCEDEYNDGVWAMRNPVTEKSWRDVCEYLEKNFDSSIEELTAV